MEKDTKSLNKPMFMTLVRNVLGVFRPVLKNFKYLRKCKFTKAYKLNVFFFIFEPYKKHPGIADRIKAIVSAYNIAKANGYEFKLYFETPFKLADYLVPKFDWEASLDELEYSLCDTRLFNERYCEELIKLIPNKQYHCYNYQGHHMPRIFPNTGVKWCDLFHELFEPSDKLKSAYQALNLKARSYVSVHIRFVNALENFENTFFDNRLKTQEERDALIIRCKEGISLIIKDNPNLSVCVFSDSAIFLDSLSDMPVMELERNNIGHVSEGGDDNVVFKSFFDLYAMSQSEKIYRICAPEVYSISHYALLAATIGDIPLEDLNV